MSPGMERGARKPEPLEEAAATKQQLRRHLSPAERRAVQTRLALPPEERVASTYPEVIANHRLSPAEADMRFVVNNLRRESMHWWLYTEAGRYQRELLERLGWWAA